MLCLSGALHASCDVIGGGPIVDGAQIVCSGAVVGGVNAPTIANLNIAVTANTTIDAAGAPYSLRVGANSIVDIGAGASLNAAVASKDGTIFAIRGQVLGELKSDDFYKTMIAFVYAGAHTGLVREATYVSNAGTIDGFTMGYPWQGHPSELYNEASGIVNGRVDYRGGIYILQEMPALDNTIVVNRGRMRGGTDGYSLRMATEGLANIQFTNEVGAIVEGDVGIVRSWNPGASSGVNHGDVLGRVHVHLPQFLRPDWEASGGYPQTFANFAHVGSVSVSSGVFEQKVGASFDAGATLQVWGRNVEPVTGGVGSFYFGTLQVAGAHSAGCISGIDNGPIYGGVVDLLAGAALSVSPALGDVCRFDGRIIGAGRLVKAGAGVQILGDTDPEGGSVPATNYAGGTSLLAGTLALAAPATRRSNIAAPRNIGSGPLSFDGAGARLRFDAQDLAFANAFVFNAPAVIDTNGFDATLSGASSGTSSIRKSGAGRLRWQGARAHTGTTTVDGGILQIDTSLSGPVTVADGGTLAGSGTMAGALLVQAGGTLRMAINGAVNDRLVTPAAHIGGGTLVLDPLSPAPVPSTIELVDVTGATAVVGAFENVAEGGFLHDGDTGYRISYVGGDGNDITLTALRVPNPPQALVATPGNAQLSLSFAAPMPNGSGPVTGYRAQCTPGNVVIDALQSPIVVPGLSNGVAYSCSVRTLADVGPSAATAPVVAIPVTTASAPTALTVTAGVATFSVAFSPPANNGGAVVTGFRLACDPGAWVTTGNASPLGFSGLVNGTAYGCALAAINDAGLGQSATFTVVPRTVPEVPLNLAGVGYNGEIRFTFDPPAFDGGAPITSYRVRCSPGATRIVIGPSSPLTLGGQSNGQNLTCRVRASNVAGDGPESGDIVVAARAVPSEVRNVSVVDGDAGSGIVFTVPALGAPILDYTAQCDPGSLMLTQATSPIIVAPLVNDLHYDCQVTARNAVGNGPPVTVSLSPSATIYRNGFE
ncbi:MAG: autotransporter-associated beta strand repeat-containing protein [Xanthomonadales bacterium]|nr:autotransporter-associated beta strand repeat-containing protein [Xanthomonadales bacterium]